ncbi:nudC domain-containing protein 3 [Sitodiplosis mosellana]|uniref:nudC domain-containing protein 3 n=1 Tax=Sitodiplosis mosellana TaxID=263140 RepID=UPI002443BAE5|nr:nudC domain-containing protein 3 [Sitodiplosis mosellana]
MDSTNQVIYDFSNLTANEVEIETTDDTDKSTENKVKPKVETPFFELSDYLNGALHEESHYSWSQTFTEIEIHIRLSKNVTSKNLKVNITYTSIDIHAIVDGERTKVLGGQLYDKCKAPDAMWTITGGNKLNISVDKTKEIWWKKLFQHESEIDTKKIDCSRQMNELSDETQAQINQIQFDEQQKLKGQPTSDQIKQQELLRKAWDAEGSPFKGQPFDPNIVQFQN